MTSNFRLALRLLLCVFLWFTVGRAHGENYLDYYKQIARAEQDAVTGRHAEAIQKFSAAFGQYAYNNPIDCYVAAQLAAYTGDISHCTAFLRSGLSFGLAVQTIRANPHLAPMVGNTAGMLSQKDIDSCWGLYRQRINQDARTKTNRTDNARAAPIFSGKAFVRSLSLHQPDRFGMPRRLIHTDVDARGQPAHINRRGAGHGLM